MFKPQANLLTCFLALFLRGIDNRIWEGLLEFKKDHEHPQTAGFDEGCLREVERGKAGLVRLLIHSLSCS